MGEGGKKKVYSAHDSTLDRDVALAVIKAEGLDDASRARVTREARAMGRLGDHPNVLPIHDLGEENGQPYLILPLMAGGDLDHLMDNAQDRRLSMELAIAIGKEVCLGLDYAHSRGVIHRDLKPGNVWFTSEGVAKIGDFALAVLLDRSRLTTEGMMVGTVSYMPPEQAMGGDASPQSDLYSFGAMLYEMVTGRPPFLGDDPVAIIGQHLNTPPVAPTWHRPDLPVQLESLILQLLEKDPAKRPVSAAEVGQTLESIDFGGPASLDLDGPEPPQEAPSLAGSPLYRRAFVGREEELHKLHAAFDTSVSGQGSLVMVVGEAGIGKTSICDQLATYATLRGGRTLVGHCYEQGSLSLPYLPFVEAIRTYAISREPEELRKEMGSGTPEVARIVSEVRERLPVEPRAPGDPEEDRYRLLQAVSDFVRNASFVQPLVVVLEDLHDADRGTPDMQTHIARNLSGARLLLVGTYRDVEVDRTHPLSGALTALSRISTFSRVPLRGLVADEVQRMVENIAGQEIPSQLAEAVERQTEGNPLSSRR